jgi:O-antigen ligase
VCVCAGTVLVLLHGSSELAERFEFISWGRSGRSAEGRYEIWSRGIDTLLSDLPIWGIGPDRFPSVAGTEMHNDFLGFAVERGLLGLLGLCLLGAMAFVRSIELFRIESAYGRLRSVAFPAAITATLTASMTHEVFHSREVWLIIAIQEAALWRVRRDGGASASRSSLRESPRLRTASETD